MRAKSKKLYHHGNLHDTLIETGLQLIAEKGVRALTLREIGARAGVSRTAAYRHFADKSELLAAISEAGFKQFADTLDVARNGNHPDVAARLHAMAVAYVQFAADHPAYIEVMFGSNGGVVKSGSKEGARAFSILEQTIVDGQNAGEFRSGSPLMLAQGVWAQVHGISMLGFGTGFVPFSSDLIMNGLFV